MSKKIYTFRDKAGKPYYVHDDPYGWEAVYPEEKVKMTRQHAHELVFGKCKYMEGKDVAALLDALEALGLIKFKEAPKYITVEHCGGVNEKTCTVSVDNVIEALRRIDIVCVKKEV